jgi:hypothetical protein
LWLDGVVVDGVYPIEVGGSPLTVYCDMNTEGGGWTQLYHQDTTVGLGYLPTSVWTAGINQGTPNVDQYSILNLIDEFEGVSPGFEFMIDWQNDRSDWVRWEQTENPFDVDDDAARAGLTDVVQSPTNQTGCTDFEGLGLGNGSSTLDGSTSSCWFWAVGTSGPYKGGIPAYADSDPAGPGLNTLIATQARLWVR